MMLLGLTHAEEMINILIVDIADQKEREEYYEMPMNAKGESMNQVRFKTASQLATGTLTILYGCATLAATYVFACLGFLFGTLKYRSELMVPWLVLHLIGGFVVLVLEVVYADPYGYDLTGGSVLVYCKCVKYYIIYVVFFVYIQFFFYRDDMHNYYIISYVSLADCISILLEFENIKETNKIGNSFHSLPNTRSCKFILNI